VNARGDVSSELNRIAAAEGVTLSVLTPREDSLEDVFLQMTGAADGDNALFRSKQKVKRRFRLTRRGSSTDKEVS
jgi:hypothetical protein